VRLETAVSVFPSSCNCFLTPCLPGRSWTIIILNPPPNESFIYHRRNPPHSFCGCVDRTLCSDGDARTLTKTKNEQNQIIEIEIEIDRTRTPASHSNQRNRDGGAGGSTLGITIPFSQAVLLRRRRHPPPLILLNDASKKREGRETAEEGGAKRNMGDLRLRNGTKEEEDE
jgi:hypothetical protein